MATFTDISRGLVATAIETHNAAQSPRSKTVHVSAIIRHAALLLGIIKDESEDEEHLIHVSGGQSAGGLSVTAESLNRIAIGLAWEEWLARTICGDDPTKIFHPGEFSCDNIYGSPDCLETDDEFFVVSEFKCTWKAIRRYDDWMWQCQIKAYCRMLETRFAKLHVMFLNGDYKPPMPTYKVWAIEYTELEIAENWRMLVAHGRKHLGLKAVGMTKRRTI